MIEQLEQPKTASGISSLSERAASLRGELQGDLAELVAADETFEVLIATSEALSSRNAALDAEVNELLAVPNDGLLTPAKPKSFPTNVAFPSTSRGYFHGGGDGEGGSPDKQRLKQKQMLVRRGARR